MRISLIIFAALIAMASPSLILANAGSDFQAYGGYRKDKISTVIHSFGHNGDLLLKDNLHAKDIHIREWGSKGHILLGPLFVKGDSGYGKVSSGKYTEIVEIEELEGVTTARVEKGHTRDVMVGGGYFLDCGILKGGPLAGWSYHKQDIKMKKAISDGKADPVLEGLRYKTRWNGPWAGVDLIGCLACFQVHLSYEYHWANWRGHWALEGEDVFGGSFSDKRRSDHAYGSVWCLDWYWFYCPGTYASVNLNTSRWSADKGKEKPANGTFVEIGHPEVGRDKVKEATWASYSVTFGLGSAF